MKALLYFLALATLLQGHAVLWPVDDQKYYSVDDINSILQPTKSGRKESAHFGMVRNSGRRFHEGIDIKPSKRDKHGEAANTIVAILPGRIAHINKIGGNSSYGKYIVIEHTDLALPLYSLYGHLKSIDPSLRIGNYINKGDSLGIMGRTSMSGKIPKHRAHLHFEIGFKISDGFNQWYTDQRYKDRNFHHLWNGMNLVGIDPLDFYKSIEAGKSSSLTEYFQSLPTGFRLRVNTNKVPSYLKHYPSLISGTLKPQYLQGWLIDFTWYGLPKRWEPIYGKAEGSKRIEVIAYNEDSINSMKHYKILIPRQTNNMPSIGKNLKRITNLLFKY